ncbi:MAG: diguanylate cyclase domain-containing protein [Gaiellales bacterium]
MLGRRPDAFEAGLADLVAACESGVDLAGVLEAARRAASAAAGGAEAAAYAIADDGTNLRLVGGPGVDELAIPAEPEPHHVDGAWVVPLISARRTVGCLLVRAPADAKIDRVRLVAGIAAQAVEVARLWEAVAGGASHDPLTGLPGHRSFDRVLARELSRAMRTGDSVAVGVVAVDGMTERNEADGLPAGDELLRTAAECFGGGVRPYDTVCRLGGNDFALVLPAMEAEPARALIERLAAAFAASAGGATVSAGVAAFPANGDTQAELMRLATGALYWARRGGGGRVVAYDANVVEALSGEEHARRLERDTYERTLRALDAARGHSATARAVSDYAGHLAAELGFPPERADRLRMVAFLYDATAPGAEPRERARVAARVASSALDAEAAGWLEAPAAGGADGPLESRIIALAAAFVEAGGHTGNAGAGRALADLWQRRDEFDPACMRALESLLAAREAV